jgi:hypothetical protein
MSLRTRGALLASAVLTLAACGEDPTAPTATGPRGAVIASALREDKLATVEWEGRFPALYIQNGDGSGRFRVHFTNVHDKIEGNWPAEMLPVSDDHIIAMGRPTWSPDGQQLAIVVSVAFDQSQVIVMNADGRQLRTESLNGQYIMGDVDWSPDSRRIAYSMATQGHARFVDLFITDLVMEKVQRITKEGRFGVYDQYRWDANGTGLWFTQFDSWSEDGWNRIARVHHWSPSGQVDVLEEKAFGDLQALSRDGSFGLSVRYTKEGQQEFVRQPLQKGGEELVLARGEFRYAQLLEGDAEAILAWYDARGAGSYSVHSMVTGEDRGLLKIAPNASTFALMRAAR